VEDIRPSIESIISFLNEKKSKTINIVAPSCFITQYCLADRKEKKGKNGSCKYFRFFKMVLQSEEP
jgi:hypothetical protein